MYRRIVVAVEPWARVAVVASIPVAVLLVDPRGLSPFGPLKWMALSTAVLAGAAVTMWRGRLSAARGPALAWAGFLLVALLAAARGVDPLYAWIGTPERRFGVLTWVLCALAFLIGQSLARREARAVASAVLGTALVVGAWAIAEALGWQPLELAGRGMRPVGPFGSSAYLGAAAVVIGAVALGIGLDTGWNLRARRIGSAGAAACGVALIASGARAAWLGGVVAMVMAFWPRLRNRRPRGLSSLQLAEADAEPAPPSRAVAGGTGAGGTSDADPGRRASWLAVAAVVGIAAGLASVTGVAGRVPDVVTDREGGARGRLDEWRVALRVIGDNPLIGLGPEGYRIAFGSSVDDEYERTHGRRPLPDRAHSAPLDVAATTGVVGLAAYAVLLISVLRYMVVALRSRAGTTGHALSWRGAWVTGAAAGVVAYFTQSLFLFPIAELEPLVWLLVGVVVAQTSRGAGAAEPGARTGKPAWSVEARRRLVLPVGRVSRGTGADDARVSSGEPPRLAEFRLPRVLPVVAAISAVFAFTAGALDVVADRKARGILEAVPATDTGALRPVRPAELRPDALRYRLVAARSLLATGSATGIEMALDQLAAGLRVSPRDPVVRAERARLLLEKARRTGFRTDVLAARTELRRLAADDPRNAEVLLRLGLAEELSGQEAVAERAWLAAERLAPRSAAASTNLALAYARTGRTAEAAAAANRALARDPSSQRAKAVLRQVDGT